MLAPSSLLHVCFVIVILWYSSPVLFLTAAFHFCSSVQLLVSRLAVAAAVGNQVCVAIVLDFDRALAFVIVVLCPV